MVVPLVVALEWPLLLWSHPKSLAKIYAKQPGALEPVRMTVRPDALVVASRKSEARVEWHAIRNIATTGEHTLFVMGRYQVIALPWRSFDSPSAAQRLTVLAREYWLAAATAPRPQGQIPADIAELLGPERIVVSYELTMWDIRVLIAGQLRRKRRFWIGLGIGGSVFGLLASLFVGPGWGVIAGLGLIALILGLVLGTSLINARYAKGVLGPHTLVAAPAGYWSEAPGVVSSVQRWSVFTDIAANGRHLLLHRGPDMVVGIPRRAFASAGEVDRFLAQVTRWRLAQLAEDRAQAPA
jgi:hypothetical protein